MLKCGHIFCKTQGKAWKKSQKHNKQMKLLEEKSFLGQKKMCSKIGEPAYQKAAKYEKSMVCLSLSQAFHFALPLKLQHFMLLPSKNQKLLFHIFTQTKWQMHILLYSHSRANAFCLCSLHYDSSFGAALRFINSHFHSEHLPCFDIGQKQPIQHDVMFECQVTFRNIEKRKEFKGKE